VGWVELEGRNSQAPSESPTLTSQRLSKSRPILLRLRANRHAKFAWGGGVPHYGGRVGVKGWVWYPVEARHIRHNLCVETEALSHSVYELDALQVLGLGTRPPNRGEGVGLGVTNGASVISVSCWLPIVTKALSLTVCAQPSIVRQTEGQTDRIAIAYSDLMLRMLHIGCKNDLVVSYWRRHCNLNGTNWR
jgi:hypothetical protein